MVPRVLAALSSTLLLCALGVGCSWTSSHGDPNWVEPDWRASFPIGLVLEYEGALGRWRHRERRVVVSHDPVCVTEITTLNEWGARLFPPTREELRWGLHEWPWHRIENHRRPEFEEEYVQTPLGRLRCRKFTPTPLESEDWRAMTVWFRGQSPSSSNLPSESVTARNESREAWSGGAQLILVTAAPFSVKKAFPR